MAWQNEASRTLGYHRRRAAIRGDDGQSGHIPPPLRLPPAPFKPSFHPRLPFQNPFRPLACSRIIRHWTVRNPFPPFPAPVQPSSSTLVYSVHSYEPAAPIVRTSKRDTRPRRTCHSVLPALYSPSSSPTATLTPPPPRPSTQLTLLLPTHLLPPRPVPPLGLTERGVPLAQYTR